MKVVRILLLCLLFASFTVPALADAPGVPTDFLLGCDPGGGGICTVNIDEQGNFSSSFNGFFPPYNISMSYLGASSSTDASGNPLEVFSYSISGTGGADQAALTLTTGAIGICEASATGACSLSDVVVFQSNEIDLYSAEGPINWGSALDGFTFEDANGVATWGPVGSQGGGESIAYTFTSNSVPEPSSLLLLGSGLFGLGGVIRRRFSI